MTEPITPEVGGLKWKADGKDLWMYDPRDKEHIGTPPSAEYVATFRTVKLAQGFAAWMNGGELFPDANTSPALSLTQSEREAVEFLKRYAKPVRECELAVEAELRVKAPFVTMSEAIFTVCNLAERAGRTEADIAKKFVDQCRNSFASNTEIPQEDLAWMNRLLANELLKLTPDNIPKG